MHGQIPRSTSSSSAGSAGGGASQSLASAVGQEKVSFPLYVSIYYIRSNKFY
jgi:hypothetical protein